LGPPATAWCAWRRVVPLVSLPGSRLSVYLDMPTYEFFEHTADVGIRAYGPTLVEALSAACDALTDVMTGGAQVMSGSQKSFGINASDTEQLVVDTLSHLVYLFDAEGFVPGRCDIDLDENLSAHVTARGEQFDPDRHGEGLDVKAVAYHMLKVERQDSGDWMIRVLLDV